MPTGETSVNSDSCRPCPLSEFGCGPEAGQEDGCATNCSPGAPGLVFLLPLAAAVLGAVLTDRLLGSQPVAQLLGALVGLTVGVVLAVGVTRALGSFSGIGRRGA